VWARQEIKTLFQRLLERHHCTLEDPCFWWSLADPMDSAGEKRDDPGTEQPDRTLPLDSHTTDVNPTNPREDAGEAAPDNAAAVYPHHQANSSLDSGIETEYQTDANLDAVSANGTAGSWTAQQGAAPPMEAQFAEEQELTPDVRRVPKRHRRRKCGAVSHRYDF
jgi:hypothetical protein